MASGGSLPPLVPQPVGDAGRSMQRAAVVNLPLREPLVAERDLEPAQNDAVLLPEPRAAKSASDVPELPELLIARSPLPLILARCLAPQASSSGADLRPSFTASFIPSCLAPQAASS